MQSEEPHGRWSSTGRSPDGLRAERRRLDQTNILPVVRFSWIRSAGFQTRKEVARIASAIAARKVEIHEGGNIHGMAVTADNKTLVVTSRQNSALRILASGLKALGGADVGSAPDWVTLHPTARRP
jgi:hypothetical protein